MLKTSTQWVNSNRKPIAFGSQEGQFWTMRSKAFILCLRSFLGEYKLLNMMLYCESFHDF